MPVEDIELSDSEAPRPAEGVTLEETFSPAFRTLQEVEEHHQEEEDSQTSDAESPIKSRAILQNLQGSMATSTSTTSYEINGIKIAVASQAIERGSDTLYTKTARKKYKGKERNELLERIQKQQQEVFKSITISINDPNKMTNTHSVAQLLAENKRNLIKYDLHDVFSIVIPLAGAFDSSSAEFTKLTTDPNDATKPVTKDLFTEYLSLTAEQVAQSSKWYSTFVPTDELMQENLRWSLAYYEKNVEKTLYSKVHAQLLAYPVDTRGGPLFLKLLLDRVSTTNEANLKAIIHVTETYSIKTSCPPHNLAICLK